MRHLVLGASGLVGGALHRQLHRSGETAAGTYFTFPVKGLVRFDLRQTQGLAKLFDEHRPDIVYLASAMGHADKCQDEPELCRSVNVDATAAVARICQERGARLVFFSSDYIFDGQKGPYQENDAVHPLSVYGQSKAEAEARIKKELTDHLIIRTTVIYGWEAQGKNFIMNLVRTLGAGGPMRVADDQVGTPTYVEDLAAAVIDLAKKGCDGIYNVAGRDRLDRYRFALMAASIFNLDASKITPASTEKLKQRAPRPLDAGLDCAKTERELGRKLLGSREGLESMKKTPNPYALESQVQRS
ncbi:MAG: SDR family oxidoreductase [Elusimicrobia bacterium]|nr:SDR family oxidoreductase [Elusimicrobiota bacterium]